MYRFSDIPDEMLARFINDGCTEKERNLILDLATEDDVKMLAVAYKANEKYKEKIAKRKSRPTMIAVKGQRSEVIGGRAAFHSLEPLQPLGRVAFINKGESIDISSPFNNQMLAFINNNNDPIIPKKPNNDRNNIEKEKFTKLPNEFIKSNSTAQKTQPKRGDGRTSATPYSISTKEDLFQLGRDVDYDKNRDRRYYILENDIDLSHIKDWDPIARHVFNRHFNGNNKTIKLNINGERYYRGLGLFLLIGEIGVVCNLKIEGDIIADNGCIGSIASVNYGKIINCESQVNITGNNLIGGLVGLNRGKIYSSSHRGSIKGKEEVGGIAGYNSHNGSIVGCSNMGLIEGKHIVGGIVGLNDEGSITSSHNNGSIIGSNEIGGIAGKSIQGTITSCSNSNGGFLNVKNREYIGNIVGRNEDSDIF